jgi:tryptophanyl-tRNA synthetase
MKIFSGIRPSGDLHIGNYIGAVKQWIKLQEDNEAIFCIVDLHAITTPYSAKDLQEKIISQATSYLALGVDPEKCILFVQSHVKEHSELAWLLGSMTSMGELQRMTQYKEKSKKQKNINSGLFNYPVLMAADILLYETEIVPVGEDQKQHVEMARSIAKKFNNYFGDTFKIPEVQIEKVGARIMSLQNPKNKMSKTDNDQGAIGLFEGPEIIRKKILRSVTDNDTKIKYDIIRKPGISNLLTIYSSFKETTIKKSEAEMKDKNYSEFKKIIADLLIEKLEPMRKRKQDLDSRKVYISEILSQGSKRAESIAKTTMLRVHKNMGLLNH